MPAASVIIRSFNEAEYIEDALETVTQQAYDDFEIVLVDSGSTDGTLEIAREYVDEITFVDPRNFTFGYSLNVGCEAAAGEYLVFLSAHAIPTDEEWLGTLVTNLYDDDVAMTYSNQTGAGPTKLPENRLFDQLFPEERRRQHPPDYFANNASSAIKKSLWEEHAFDEWLTGHEDIEWAKHFMDRGYAVVYEPEACIYHIHDETWEQVYHRFEREAIADREIGIRSPKERWREYASIPRDIVTDTVAAIRHDRLDAKTLRNILRFRYCQHAGTANGLQKEQDLESDRYEYYYPEANEQVRIEKPGEITVRQSSLPEVRPNDVLIEVAYAGITDRELGPYRGNEEAFPVVPGREYVGEVVDIGANVEWISLGDHVTGGSVFHCGLCSACDEHRYTACENRTELGTSTEDGAFSRFITVPSTHVYELPSNVSLECATLAGPLAQIVDGFVRAESFLPTQNGRVCVVGDGLLTELVEVYLKRQGHSWCAIDDVTSASTIGSCQLVVVASKSKRQIQQVLRRTSAGTTIVLLDTAQKDLTISPDDIAEKILVTAQRGGGSRFDDALQLLADGTYEHLLNGRYSVDRFVDDPLAAHSSSEMSLLELDAES
jgi:threonine dehydrogenase-like Zn-dependent dehydrogenase/glycosyltransferase involved in cell wall biosynthesis